MSEYRLYVGRYQLNGFNQFETVRRVSRVLVASGYDSPERGSDLALVQLDGPVEWSEYVRPVCLPDTGVRFPGGRPCYVTGWGHIRQGGGLWGAYSGGGWGGLMVILVLTLFGVYQPPAMQIS